MNDFVCYLARSELISRGLLKFIKLKFMNNEVTEPGDVHLRILSVI